MKLQDFLQMMETVAPLSLAMDFDNPGLLIGTNKPEIKKVLVALDCSMSTAQEAVDTGCDLLLTHHPLFLNGVKRILPDDPETAAAYLLLRNGIALFTAHTNLDAAQGGVNDCLAAALGLHTVVPLLPDNMGRIGFVRETTLKGFARFVEEKLIARVRVAGNFAAPVRRVAVLGGAGASEISAAKAAGADTFVTGEMKHHFAIAAQFLGLNVIEAGHYETENVVLLPWIEHLQRLSDDVQYSLTRLESACLRGVD